MNSKVEQASKPLIDERQQVLERWLNDVTGASLQGSPASSDASFRRYFRYQINGQSRVAMDAPPPEDCRPFVDIAQRLAQAGLHVPEIVASDLERGFLLLSDLGKQTYLEVINDSNADALFADAIDCLLVMQQQVVTDGLPCYDEALLRRELQLFPEWYLQRHLGLVIDQTLQRDLDDLFDFLMKQILSQPQVFVHRDFMPRNLMISTPNPGVLDFQDAVLGPISYDPICLFKDAFVSWPEDKVSQWLALYWRRARLAELPVPTRFDDFVRDCDLMGMQRHLKVIGIFARICHRDGKPHYLDDVPRFFDYLQHVLVRRSEIPGLAAILARVAAHEARS